MIMKVMIKKSTLASLLYGLLFAVNSHAALFDDKEARKKIVEIETVVNSQNQATQKELTDLKVRVQAIEAITKGQVLSDMHSQIEALKQEVARLKGELEVATHNVEATQQRQKDLYGDTDTRIRKLEELGVPAAAAGATEAGSTTPAPSRNTQEYQLLELANGLSKEFKHKDAFNAYDKFLKDYPNSALADEATYGLGYTQFALRSYKSSIVTQQKLLELYPESPKASDAMFNMANSQIQLGQVPSAKKTLRDLIAKFPNSDVIPAAQKRLKALEAIR